jgi:hypothetical protein
MRIREYLCFCNFLNFFLRIFANQKKTFSFPSNEGTGTSFAVRFNILFIFVVNPLLSFVGLVVRWAGTRAETLMSGFIPDHSSLAESANLDFRGNKLLKEIVAGRVSYVDVLNRIAIKKLFKLLLARVRYSPVTQARFPAETCLS